MAKIVYNPETLSYEMVEESKALRIFSRVVFVIAAVASVYLYFWLYTSVLGLDLPKTAILKNQRAAWDYKMEALASSMAKSEQVLEGIEARNDDVYRSLYGLGEIPVEMKESGLGGINRYSELDDIGATAELKSLAKHMDVLTKRVYLQSKALDEVGQLARQAGDMISCVPSVPPLLPEKSNFHLSSPFGGRRDPVYGGHENHKGQDIAAKKGTPVYAPGDGVVEVAQCNFNGYGNEIVIDHGFGYKTRYGHLNTMDVNVGMKVLRGEMIGTVGSTGKSTGAHLHYEVIYKGDYVNPMHYMDVNIPLEEYKAMINKRKEDSPVGKMRSTSELLRRRGNGTR